MLLTKSLEWSKGLSTKSALDRRPFDENLLVKRHSIIFSLLDAFDQLLGQIAHFFKSTNLCVFLKGECVARA
jgi:hypothetical protein